ncbi:MAG: hypothetical protein ACFFCI_11390 [Promethearchaeota archaeon]
MDWRDIVNTLSLWYNEFVDWYLAQPIYGQILAIVGIIAIIALIIVILYYVLKGIAYLIYYLLKGIYLILKGIGLGIYKLCEGFYYLVAGKPRPVKQSEGENSENLSQEIRLDSNFLYCSECGRRFSKKMINNVYNRGITYCIFCGMEFKLIKIHQPALQH